LCAAHELQRALKHQAHADARYALAQPLYLRIAEAISTKPAVVSNVLMQGTRFSSPNPAQQAIKPLRQVVSPGHSQRAASQRRHLHHSALPPHAHAQQHSAARGR
jgi:hypothetical protein